MLSALWGSQNASLSTNSSRDRRSNVPLTWALYQRRPLRDRASIKLQRVQGLGMTKGAWRLIRSSNKSLIHKSKHFPSVNLQPVKGYV